MPAGSDYSRFVVCRDLAKLKSSTKFPNAHLSTCYVNMMIRHLKCSNIFNFRFSKKVWKLYTVWLIKNGKNDQNQIQKKYQMQ